MNNNLDFILNRKSIKKYKDTMVSTNDLDKIIECGKYAPSGMNKQSAIILAVTNKEMRDKLSKLNAKIMGNENIDPFYNAPVVLVVLADKDVPTYIYDGSVVMENLLLAAHTLGLGACWIHRAKEMFETEEGKSILNSLGINGNYEGVGNCIIGYPDMDPVDKPRKDNYVYYIK